MNDVLEDGLNGPAGLNFRHIRRFEIPHRERRPGDRLYVAIGGTRSIGNARISHRDADAALSRGDRTSATAATLGISFNTLKTHTKRIYAKVGVQGQA
jgi:hypothetical protein